MSGREVVAVDLCQCKQQAAGSRYATRRRMQVCTQLGFNCSAVPVRTALIAPGGPDDATSRESRKLRPFDGTERKWSNKAGRGGVYPSEGCNIFPARQQMSLRFAPAVTYQQVFF